MQVRATAKTRFFAVKIVLIRLFVPFAEISFWIAGNFFCEVAANNLQSVEEQAQYSWFPPSDGRQSGVKADKALLRGRHDQGIDGSRVAPPRPASQPPPAALPGRQTRRRAVLAQVRNPPPAAVRLVGQQVCRRNRRRHRRAQLRSGAEQSRP